jgi:hypothetical protein
MPRHVTACDLPAFADFSPADSEFHCIFPALTRGFTSYNDRVNYGDRGTASQIRERILLSIRRITGPDDADLREYAELWYCVSWCRIRVVDQRRRDRIVRKWQTELLEQR